MVGRTQSSMADDAMADGASEMGVASEMEVVADEAQVEAQVVEAPAQSPEDAVTEALAGFVETALGQTCRKFKIKRNKELQDNANSVGQTLIGRIEKGGKGAPDSAHTAVAELVRQLELALSESGCMTASQWSYFSTIMQRQSGIKPAEVVVDDAGGKDKDDVARKGGSALAKGPPSWTWAEKGALCEVTVEGDWWQAKVVKVNKGLPPSHSPELAPCARHLAV